MRKRKLELLAPAKNAAIGRIAILAGADAVYIGAPAFGARAAASNSIEDIAKLADFAHKFRAKVYVTLNTILFDNELEEAREIVYALYEAGVDALIVQDMAYLMMDLPPIALHASTQCDIRTPQKAKWLAEAGFSQLVLPRELTIEEIKATAETAGVPIEVFVHGALCVSFSGDCQAGCVAMNRSANRGVCPQMCRLQYDLVDKDGNSVAPAKHYLSLSDLNQSGNLAELVAAGASSFKIEGRLKDERYVANVTAEYSRLLNKIVAESGGALERSSVGESVYGFTPDLDKTFNRGYTSYFLTRQQARIASIDTPKWIGVPIGTVLKVNSGRIYSIETKLTTELSNGDGLAYFDSKGNFYGFRVNKAEGNIIYPANVPENIATGTKLYRNFDKKFLEHFDKENAGCNRSIYYNVTLLLTDKDSISVSATDERGTKAELLLEYGGELAATPQQEQRKKIFSKTGGTIYRLGTFEDKLGNRFIPASALTDARRKILSLLDENAAASYQRDLRKPNILPKHCFEGLELSYHDNVANQLSEQFYTEYGAKIRQKAIEIEKPKGETVVMTTRYCLRKELGACLKEKNRDKLPSPLFLRNDSGVYRLDFDCRNCGMKIIKCK